MVFSPAPHSMGPRFSGTYNIDSNIIFRRSDIDRGQEDYRQVEAVFDHYAAQIDAAHPLAKIHYKNNEDYPRQEPTDLITVEIPTEFPKELIHHSFYQKVGRSAIAQDSPTILQGNTGGKTPGEFAEGVIQTFLRGCQLIQGPLPNAPYQNRRVSLDEALLAPRRFSATLGNAVDQHFHRTRQLLEDQASSWNALPESVQVKVEPLENYRSDATEICDKLTMTLKDRFGNDITVPLGTQLIFKKSNRRSVTEAQKEATADAEAPQVDLEGFYNTCLAQAQHWVALLKPPGYDSASRKDL